MPYIHDIFISYKRDPVRDDWLVEHFVPLFSSSVREAIAAACHRPPAGIFFDQTVISKESRAFDQAGIEPGEQWREALKTAMAAARCMVAIWSPLYFYSEWCLIEWNSFRERPRSVVVPISVHDGDSFPEAARALQAPDFSDYVIIGAGFRETRAYPQFQQQIKVFAETVAKRVRDAPEFGEWKTAGGVPAPAAPDIPQQRL